MLHPIHYSLIVNIAVLVISAALSWQFARPELFLIALLVLPHVLQRFEREPFDVDIDDDDDDEPKMGFLGNPGR